jgi:enolase
VTTRWQITRARARSIYDSRGRPTIEVELTTSTACARGIAPAGASTGTFEARELRDADGLGVARACAAFVAEIAPRLVGMDVREQERIDTLLETIDGTANLGRIGGNTTIATSMAALNTAAATEAMPAWRYLAGTRDAVLPTPEIQIIGGGAHAGRRIDLQDLMIVPVGAPDWQTALDWCARLYRAVGALLAERGIGSGVADEGGHWPNVAGNEAALELLALGIDRTGLRAGEDLAISLDVAATQLVHDKEESDASVSYSLAADGVLVGTEAFTEKLLAWTRRFPIVLVEDPGGESDLRAFQRFRAGFAGRGLVVADDLVVTDASRIAAACKDGAIDAALIKPNQAGTLTRAKAALDACAANGVVPIVSARSGETEDATLVHLAVGWHAPLVKVGSITRGERTVKWNEGIRIAEALGGGRLRARAEIGL